jgi:hypothetical protein
VTETPEAVRVDCVARDGGWTCDVVIGTDPGATRHRVGVHADDLARLAPGHERPDRLVEASFAFLLEREPRTSILRTFELSVIASFFPEYPSEIGGRL